MIWNPDSDLNNVEQSEIQTSWNKITVLDGFGAQDDRAAQIVKVIKENEYHIYAC